LLALGIWLAVGVMAEIRGAVTSQHWQEDRRDVGNRN
jgi:hypothetical protein